MSGPFTVLFSIVTGLGVTHLLFERKLLNLWLVGSSGFSNRPTLTKHSLPSGSYNMHTLTKPHHTERSFQQAHTQRTSDTKPFEREGW